MTLTEYINSFPKKQRIHIRQSLAQALGVSEVYIRSMCNGNRSIPGVRALAIERETKGLVSRRESCPHLYPDELYVK